MDEARAPSKVGSSMDRLTGLPSTILDLIFAQIDYTVGDPYPGLVHRALLPAVRRAAFAKVVIHHHFQLQRLFDVLDSTPSILPLVRQLDINLWSNFDPSTSPDFAHLLSLLPELAWLHLPPRLSTLILDPETSLPATDNLEHLELEGRFFDEDSPFAIERWTLDRYTRLTTLKIHALGPVSLNLRSNIPQCTAWSSRLTTLSLYPVGPEPAALITLVASCPYLTHLELFEDIATYGDLAAVLNAVPTPTLLESLSIGRAPFSSPPFYAALARFPHLTTLTLSSGNSDPSLLPSIAALPSLRYLTLGKRTEAPPYAHLKALLSSTKQLPALRILVVDGATELRPGSEKPLPCYGAPGSAEDIVDNPRAPSVRLLELSERRGVRLEGLVGEAARRFRRQREEERAVGGCVVS
ncbi:hypothetical protein JCM10207_006814 [Rhodosporidiobolus poonsookiae]